MMRILKAQRPSALAFAALAFLTRDVSAQTASQAPATTGPTYEVVSIKPHVGDTNSGSMRQMPGGGIIFVNASLRTLITFGYSGLVSEPIGLPDWAASEHYDVNATVSLNNPTVDDRRAMMRALLAERFKFAAHMESRDQPSFDLLLARSDRRLGPGMKPTDVDCAARAAAARAATEAARAAGTPPPPPTFTPPAPGSIVPPCTMRSTGNTIEGDFTMTSFASILRTMAGRYVVDKTGLTGNYRVKLEGVEMFQRPSLDTTGGPADTTSIFTALSEQLGLKLESSHAQVEVLIVDHVERPSDN